MTLFLGSAYSSIIQPIVEMIENHEGTYTMNVNISLDDNRFVVIEVLPSVTEFISPEYVETIHSTNGSSTVSKQFDQYSHWKGTANYSTGGSSSVALSIRRPCSYSLGDEGSLVHYLRGIMRDYENNLEYSIIPAQWDNYVSDIYSDSDYHGLDNMESGLYYLGEHEIVTTDYHRFLSEHNHTNHTDSVEEEEFCGGGLEAPANETNSSFKVEVLLDINFTEVENRYLLFHVTNDKKRCDELGVQGVADDTLDLVNSVSLFYEDAGVDTGFVYRTYIVLSEQTFFVDENPWDGNGNVIPNDNGALPSGKLIEEYRRWLLNTDPDNQRFSFLNDATNDYIISHLFTHETMQSGVLGLAFVSVTCTKNYAVAIDRVNGNSNRAIVGT